MTDDWPSKSGKITEEQAKQAKRAKVLGGKTQREIAEQKQIDRLRGIKEGGPLENKVNPIGDARKHLLTEP